MTIGRDLVTKAETVTVAAIEAGLPTLVEAREIITQFHLMIRRRLETGLTPWIERARASLIASFASVQRTDRRSDHAADARQTSDVWPRENRICFKPD
jgi:transposase